MSGRADPPARRLGWVARGWAGVTAVLALAGLVLQFVLVVTGSRPDFVAVEQQPSTGTAVVRFLCYFTIQSNLLVVLSCSRVALSGRPAGRVWQVLRIDAVVGILVTGVVYAVLLAPTLTHSGWDAVANTAVHQVTPVLAVVGFLLFRPSARPDLRVLRWVPIWPAAYVLLTLGHGNVTGWYPYPFVDVGHLGYAVALRNGILLLVLIALLAAAAWAYDRVRTRSRSSRPAVDPA